MDQANRTELEAAAFRALVEHLQQRTDVQNIDLMNLSGFCRNCLWIRDIAYFITEISATVCIFTRYQNLLKHS